MLGSCSKKNLWNRKYQIECAWKAQDDQNRLKWEKVVMFHESQTARLIPVCVTPEEGMWNNTAWCCTVQTMPQKPSPLLVVTDWLSQWCWTCFSFGLRCKWWIFSVRREKSLLNCISTGNTSQQAIPLEVSAEQVGVLWLQGQDRVGWYPSGGRLQNATWEISKSKKGVRKGGGSQHTAIKN